MRKRVVITGRGVTSALGNAPAALYESLRAGRSAVRRMVEWEAEFDGPVLGAPVAADEIRFKAIPRKFRRSMGDAAAFAALAALGALEEAHLPDAELNSGRIGCAVSSTMGSSRSIIESAALLLQNRRDEMPAMQFFKCVSHSAALNIGNLLGLSGVMLAPCSACASGLQSLLLAYEQILLGRADVMIAGGADEVTPAVTGSFAQLFALADGGKYADCPGAASRPFDAERTGLVCGAGAGILVLEEYEHARARNADIYGEILGGATNTGSLHVGQSDAASIEQCVRLALADAARAPETVDYVSAHATSTVAGDSAEAAALSAVFGNRTPTASMKGHLGHTLGASGALELAALLEMTRRREMLPTLNLARPGAGCETLALPRELRTGVVVRTVAKVAVAFGGVNTVLMVNTDGF